MSHRRDILLARAENSLWIQLYVHRNFAHKRTITDSVSHFVKNANGIRTRKWLGSWEKCNPPMLGPRDMSVFTKKQIFMDAVSWSLYWEKRHEFDPLQGGKLISSGTCLVGWLRKKRVSLTRLARQCFKTEGRSKYQSNYFYTSKALSKFLRHSDLTYLFDSDGTVNIGSTFNELGPPNSMSHVSSRFCSHVDMQWQAKISDQRLCQLDLETISISTNTTMGSQDGCSSRIFEQNCQPIWSSSCSYIWRIMLSWLDFPCYKCRQ